MATYEIEHCDAPGEHKGEPLFDCPICMKADLVRVRWRRVPPGQELPVPPAYTSFREMGNWEFLRAWEKYIFGSSVLQPDYRWLAQELFWRLNGATEEPTNGH